MAGVIVSKILEIFVNVEERVNKPYASNHRSKVVVPTTQVSDAVCWNYCYGKRQVIKLMLVMTELVTIVG